jgi:hypothetical protein
MVAQLLPHSNRHCLPTPQEIGGPQDITSRRCESYWRTYRRDCGWIVDTPILPRVAPFPLRTTSLSWKSLKLSRTSQCSKILYLLSYACSVATRSCAPRPRSRVEGAPRGTSRAEIGGPDYGFCSHSFPSWLHETQPCWVSSFSSTPLVFFPGDARCLNSRSMRVLVWRVAALGQRRPGSWTTQES